MTTVEQHELETLLREIRDDLARAERLGRGTVNLHVLEYAANRLDKLLDAHGGPRYEIR
ncbi:MAG: hypothetical protein GX771_11655 [Halomonadaceae bacterium]|nr:hypothetical protein [Halomonadaceae bacterium]